MTKTLFILIFITLSTQTLKGADMIIYNGKVYTVDPHNQYAEAVAIKGNTIQAVGSNEEIKKLITHTTTVINAEKRLVLPGFNDAHLHFLGGGASLLQLNLLGCKDREEVQRRLEKAVAQSVPGAWITGRGWDHTLFNNGKWPNRELLDSVSPNNPVFVRRIDGHIGWANSKALEITGITTKTISPPGGEIVSGHNGEPTGILKESAMNLISDIIPVYTKEEHIKAARLALKEAAHLGVTSIQDNSDFIAFQIYDELEKSGELTLRVSEWLDLELAKSPEGLADKIKTAKRFTSEFLHIGLLKGFADGTLGSRTAYFFEPYSDDHSTVGMPQYIPGELLEHVAVADSMDLQVGVHCIGDKANWIALNAYNASNRTNARHRLEHAQVIRSEDIPLLSKYGVIASMQPTHCTSDLRWAEKRIGRERSKGAYAWRSIIDSGAKIAFGTDWPVEPLDPMRGLYSAVTRQNIETGYPTGGWIPEEKISIEEAIHCYTMGSAYAEFQENHKGSITPGKLADIIILSNDILTSEPSDILSTKVDVTIFNGKIIYKRIE